LCNVDLGAPIYITDRRLLTTKKQRRGEVMWSICVSFSKGSPPIY